jgi:hypothetical protein
MELEVLRAVPEWEDATQSFHPFWVDKKTLNPFWIQPRRCNQYIEAVDIAHGIQ